MAVLQKNSEKIETPDVTESESLECWEQFEALDRPVEEYFKEGWTPRKKIIKDGTLEIRIRGYYPGRKVERPEKSLGKFTEERWTYLNRVMSHVDLPKRKHTPTSKFDIPIKRPPELGKHFTPNTTTIFYFRWSVGELGYPGTFTEFVNSSIKGYFKNFRGIEPTMMVDSEKSIIKKVN